MTRRRPLLFLLLVIGLGGVLLAPGARVQGESDTTKDPLALAVERGRTLFQQPWGSGGKTCVACHGGGKNKLTGARLKAYPKFDKALSKVATGQEKLNEMIESKSKGSPLTLGSDDLTALEAYVSTLR